MNTQPRHHPDEAWIAAAANGTLDPALGLVVLGHMTYCPSCAQRHADYQAVAAALHRAAPAPEPCRRTRERVAAFCHKDYVPCPSDMAEDCCARPFADLPAPICTLAETACRTRGWQKNGRGARFLSLEPMEVPGTTVRLYEAQPYGVVSRHSHDGREVVLVLKGGYRDELGQFAAGDVEIVPPGQAHRPVADPDGCLCLASTEGEIRVLGLRGLVMRLFPFIR